MRGKFSYLLAFNFRHFFAEERTNLLDTYFAPSFCENLLPFGQFFVDLFLFSCAFYTFCAFVRNFFILFFRFLRLRRFLVAFFLCFTRRLFNAFLVALIRSVFQNSLLFVGVRMLCFNFLTFFCFFYNGISFWRCGRRFCGEKFISETIDD